MRDEDKENSQLLPSLSCKARNILQPENSDLSDPLFDETFFHLPITARSRIVHEKNQSSNWSSAKSPQVFFQATYKIRKISETFHALLSQLLCNTIFTRHIPTAHHLIGRVTFDIFETWRFKSVADSHIVHKSFYVIAMTYIGHRHKCHHLFCQTW